LALRAVDELLVALGFAAAARVELYTRARDGLFAEHGVDAAFRKALGQRYKDHRDRIGGWLGDGGLEVERLAPGIAALARRNHALAPIAARLRALDAAHALGPGLPDIALSLAHMTCNRVFHASQRAQELV